LDFVEEGPLAHPAYPFSRFSESHILQAMEEKADLQPHFVVIIFCSQMIEMSGALFLQ